MNLLPHHLGIESVQGGVGYGSASNNQSGRSNDDLTLWDQDAPSRGAVPYPHHAIAGIFWDSCINEEGRHAKRRKNISVFHSCNFPSLCNDIYHCTDTGQRKIYLVARLETSSRTALATLSESVAYPTPAVLNTSVFATFGSGERK